MCTQRGAFYSTPGARHAGITLEPIPGSASATTLPRLMRTFLSAAYDASRCIVAHDRWQSGTKVLLDPAFMCCAFERYQYMNLIFLACFCCSADRFTALTKVYLSRGRVGTLKLRSLQRPCSKLAYPEL